MPKNLRKRHQTWYARVGVDPKYRKLIGRTETLRSLKTSDLRRAEAIKHGVVQEIKDYHERLIQEAKLGVEGHRQDAVTLRKMVDDGQLDTDDASEILSTNLEERLSQRLTAAQIEALTKDDIDPSIRTSFKVLGDPDYMPLTVAIKSYLDLIESTVIPGTWDHKRRQLDLLSDWTGEIDVTDIDRILATRYINEGILTKGNAPNTNKSDIAVLSAFFNHLIDEGLYTHANPFMRRGRKLKGSSKGTSFISNRAWTADELKKLFKTLNEQRKGTTKWKAGIAARLSLYSGMRQEEVCGLKIDAVNLSDNFMTVADAKNENSIRQVPIHGELRGLIEGIIEESTDDYVISGLPKGTRNKKRGHSLGNRFSDVKSELFPDSQPRELTFHGLRSTFITAMEEAGVPQSTANLVVGHARQNLSYGLYSKGPGIDALRVAVAAVNFE